MINVVIDGIINNVTNKWRNNVKKFNSKDVTNNVINIPDYWDTDKVINAFDKLDTYELYEYFGCSNAASFTRKMKPVFPMRPEKTPYAKYVKSLLVERAKWSPGQKAEPTQENY